MDVIYLSRKFLLSMYLLALGIYFIAKEKITQEQFMWIIMATVVSYIVGQTIVKATDNGIYPKFFDRLKALFTREFIMAIATITICSILMYFGKIGNPIWFSVVIAIAPAFNVVTPIAKL